jgi:hypothetical protein
MYVPHIRLKNNITGIMTIKLKRIVQELFENCKNLFNILYPHGLKSVLKNQYFGKMQLRTIEIYELIPRFTDLVDGITEIYMEEFLM